MDVISRGVKDQKPWCMLFADNMVLCSTSRDEVEQKTENWRRALEDRGLKISRKKTEYLRFLDGRDEEVRLQGEIIKIVDRFKYLGSTVAEDGNLDAEIAHRIQCGWRNWKKYVSALYVTEELVRRLRGMSIKLWSGLLCHMVQKLGRQRRHRRSCR